MMKLLLLKRNSRSRIQRFRGSGLSAPGSDFGDLVTSDNSGSVIGGVEIGRPSDAVWHIQHGLENVWGFYPTLVPNLERGTQNL